MAKNGAIALVADTKPAEPIDEAAEMERVKLQDGRYTPMIQFLPSLFCFKITLAHKTLADLNPPVFYIGGPVWLKAAGQLLQSLDFGMGGR
jgi:hypothetical protein